MRGRVILLFLSLLLFGTTATPQCTFQFDHSAELRASFVDLAIEGNDLWAATIYGVHLYERGVDPPQLVASIAVPGLTRSIEVKDGTAFAGSGAALYALRREGDRLLNAGSATLSGTANDLAIAGATLYVATSAGIESFDATAALTRRTSLQTSTNNVLSLATAEAVLYAADGDSSVERFNISAGPVALPALTTLASANAVSVAGGRVFISDGLQTDIFTAVPPARAASIPYGSVAFAAAGDLIFAAGNDRRFRALDIAALQEPIELFAADVIPAGGTVNRVAAMRIANDRLYVAGGDTGLASYDIRSFRAPYPVRSYSFGAKTSALATTTNLYVGNAGGGITDLTRTASGALLVSRTWGTPQTHLVHDFDNDFLLTSSGATLTEWTVRASPPAVVSTATFPSPVAGAVRNGSKAYALLSDGSLWSADLTQQTPAPVAVAVPIGSFIARSEQGIAIAQNKADATVEVRFYRGGDLTAAPQVTAVQGVTPTLALGASRAAVFTYLGITVIDFSGASPVPRVLPQSTGSIVNDLAITGSKLVALTGTAVRTWDLDANRFERHIDLPAAGTAITAVTDAAVLTAGGVIAVNYTTNSQTPILTGVAGSNQYYRKGVASPTRLYLFDGLRVVAFDTAQSPAPQWLFTLPAAGTLDVAASENALFTLSNSGVVNAWSPAGVFLASMTLNEGSDAAPLSIFAINGAPWVSISRGCLTTGCEKKTLVLDPLTLVPTATLAGGVVDASTAGTTAYALFDLPKEMRTYRVSDPLHPAVIGSRPSDGVPVSVAGAGGSLYALADRLLEYPESLLTKTAEYLSTIPSAPTMRLRVDSGCAVITGRSAAADTYAVPSWAARPALPLPAGARSLMLTPSRAIVLTDYSIELWSRGAKPVPGRRRAAQ
jgi:hypothetical protein